MAALNQERGTNKSPGTLLDLQMTVLLPGALCHYTGTGAEACARRIYAHTHTQLWESIKPTAETNTGSIYQAEEEEGVDGGNNTQHAPICLADLIGAQEDMGGIVAKWTADSMFFPP